MYTINRQFVSLSLITILSFLFINTYAQTISDQDLKMNITIIKNPVKSILKLEPRVFEYDTDKFKSLGLKQGEQYGFLAETMNDVFPAMVSSKNISYMYGKNTYRDSKIQTIDEVKLIPVLVASIQELYQEIEQLKKEIKALNKQKQDTAASVQQ